MMTSPPLLRVGLRYISRIARDPRRATPGRSRLAMSRIIRGSTQVVSITRLSTSPPRTTPMHSTVPMHASSAVVPNAIVCPGGLDPFNYMPMKKLGNARWRPLDYFSEMLDGIDALDGVILHTYTHGPDPAAITHLKRFGDGSGPLADHYYDFQSYRTFMERIPAKWRDVPVYITEMNHIHRPSGEHDQGWVNQNVGWLRAAYAEIARWNQQPYAQQIRCALVYRWMGDAWAIEDKPEVLTEYKQVLQTDYRWRVAPQHEPSSFAAAFLSAEGAQPTELEERFLILPDDLAQIAGIGEKPSRR